MSHYNLVNGSPVLTEYPTGSTKLSRNVAALDPSVPGGGYVQFPDLDPAILQASQVTLTAAQIKALNTTPIMLIPARGAGTIIDIESIVAKLVYGSVAFTGANAIETRFTNGSGAKVAADIGSTFLNGTANAIDHVGGVVTELTPVANAAVVLAVPTANPGAGDSTLVVTAFYRVITP